jgi:hypothetical protein
MGAGEEMECVRIALPGFSRERTFDFRDKVIIRIKYESIYGDKDEVSNGFTRQQ